MLALGVAAVLLLLGRALAESYSDYLWYDALGAGALWRMRMSAVATLKIGSAAAAGVFAFANLYAVRQSVVQLVFPRRLGNLEISEEVSGKYLMGAAIALSAVLAMLLAMPRADHLHGIIRVENFLERLHEVTDRRSGGFLDENIALLTMPVCVQYQIDRIVQ